MWPQPQYATAPQSFAGFRSGTICTQSTTTMVRPSSPVKRVDAVVTGLVGQRGRRHHQINRSLPTVLVEYAPGETTYTITGLGLLARVAVNAGGEQYLYYHADGLGSTRAITFTGESYDATTRSYYLRTRHYASPSPTRPATGAASRMRMLATILPRWPTVAECVPPVSRLPPHRRYW